MRDFLDFIELPIVQGKKRIKLENNRAAHPTQKPEKLLELIILASSNENDIVLDPFFGKGTTGFVAQKLKRNWIGIERNADYINISKKRMNEKHTTDYVGCLKVLKSLPEKSVDLIFADPPYNLSGEGYLTTQNGKVAKLHKGDWDVIVDIHKFNEAWIKECIRVLSDTGTIWISGTLHNHPSVGVILKKLGLWIINDVIWFKRNATPLLSTNRLAPSTELIWIASKSKKYLFNYAIAKQINGGKQMKNLWEINAERHKTKHPTEKPETLMQRIILLGSNEGQLVLDPFMGSGTTGAVSKQLNRNFIGIEISKEYFDIANQRINNEIANEVQINEYSANESNKSKQLLLMEDKVKYKRKKKVDLI